MQQRVKEALELVELPEMCDRRPSQLSGGQQQRVALARAIIKQPDVLLLDEPLAALDLKLRQAMRFELKELQRQLGTTFVYVTHDQEEAMTMSDRIAVMDQGRVLQIGSPVEVYDHSANHFVADFIGETNFIDCQVKACNGETATVLIGEKVELEVACDPQAAAGQTGTVIIRPEKIDLHAEPMNGGQDVTFLSGIVETLVWIGTDTRFTVWLAEGVEVVVRHQNMRLGDPLVNLRRGDTVYLSWQKKAARLLTS
jgi:spermidine/putrescine transport system ATP-binding protein